ncbi:mitochondrial import inner membrane translocase subunit Tim21-like [Diadema setosum]|uniref:mitochondrial import inner membrane translocase subunit Tim21-like n=1 Tax=Diadema setosum TaxID=31175 RepID=UPI003B3BCE58
MIAELWSRGVCCASRILPSTVSSGTVSGRRCLSALTCHGIIWNHRIKLPSQPGSRLSQSMQVSSEGASLAKYPEMCRQCSPLLHPSNITMVTSIATRRRFLVQSSAIKQQRKAVVEKKSTSGGQQLTIGQKFAQTSKDVSYAGIIVLGIGVTGLMFYTVGKELFSSNSPNGIYTNALKLCKNNVQIQDALGTPIKGYGEMTRRKRRRHVSHLEYSQNGVNFMRMKFYLEGPHRKATVHLEMKQNENGRYEYRYLFVELDGYPSGTIILEDNR